MVTLCVFMASLIGNADRKMARAFAAKFDAEPRPRLTDWSGTAAARQ